MNVPNAFHQTRFSTIQDAFQHGLNERFWTHGITINQGNLWSVSKSECVRRLNYIRARLARAMFGNHWRSKAQLIFLVFKQGSKKSGNEHYHALMGIVGDHDWSNNRIGLKIQEIERNRHRSHWEKSAHIDWNWREANRFHGYCGREVRCYSDDCDDYFVM